MSTKQKRAGHRTHTQRIIEKAEQLLSQTHISETTAYELTGHMKVLSSKLEILHTLDMSILDEIDEAKDANGAQVTKELEDIEKYTTDYETRFAIIEAKFQHLCVPTPNPNSNHVSSGQSIATAGNPFRLPKIILKNFSGKQLEWLSFYVDFEAGVHNTSMPDEAKLRYLKAHLSGPPLHAIDTLSLGMDKILSYADALKTLKERYADNDVNIECHISALCELDAPADTPEALLAFYDSIQSHLRALRYLGKTDIQLNELCVPLIRRKLPRNVRVQLKRVRGSKTWTLPEFLAELFNEIRATCDGNFNFDPSDTSGHTSDRKLSQMTAAFALNVRQNPAKRTQSASPIRGRRDTPPRSSCPFCKKENHRASECRVVVNPEDRLDILNRDNLCINCTGPHNRSECKSTRTCVECRGTHHTSIHEAFSPPPSQVKNQDPTGGPRLRRLSLSPARQSNTSSDGTRTQVSLAQASQDSE